MFAILAHERLQPTWPLGKWPGERYLGSPEAAFLRLFNAGECSCSMAPGYVFEPVKSAHDGNFSGGLHRKYYTEKMSIVNLLGRA